MSTFTTTNRFMTDVEPVSVRALATCTYADHGAFWAPADAAQAARKRIADRPFTTPGSDSRGAVV